MKFHSLRRSLVAGVFALITATLLGSCGGGGASTSLQGGTLALIPGSGSIYAGVPTEFTIVGGRAPYALSSTEAQLLPVPSMVNGNRFTVVANNPGVVDPGQDPTLVPSRSVIIQVRDSAGIIALSGQFNVLQNFLTGYGVNFTPIACAGIPATTTGTTGLSVPAGCEVNVAINATVGGNRVGDRPVRLSVIRGPFFFIDPVTGATSNSIDVRSDHAGRINALIRTITGVPTQIAILRVTDIATGVYTDTVFTISGSTSTTTLTAIPATITFTGPNDATCGTGEADVFVFDGSPPYSAVSTNPNVVVFPIDANNNPGIFRIRATNSNVCLESTVIITDRNGARVTVRVTTEPGENPAPAPPAPPVTTTPSSITLGCGQSGSVSITGGAPPYSASSATPGISAVVTGNTLTITRAAVGSTGATGTPTSATVNVTDGATVAPVSVTTPTTCP